MFVTHMALNDRHPFTDLCLREEEQKFRQLAAEEAKAGVDPALASCSLTLAAVISFKYLAWFLSSYDHDCLEVVHNTKKVWSNWVHLSQVLGREGGYAWMLGMFYVTVVQAVLFYRLETCVMTPRIGKITGVLYHWVVRRLT